jgi:tRNA threonylcarbamoyladenosine modification (KEOPS) complex  Pcc1 subunit
MIKMKVKDHLSLQFSSPIYASIFFRSFSPEIDSLPMKRSSLQIYPPRGESDIKIIIHAQDAVAFRATINTLIQTAYIVEKTLQIIDSS